MKKIILTAILVLATMGVQAQTQKTELATAKPQTAAAAKAAEIKFDTLSHDFGTFSEKDPVVKCTFNFTNVGTAPLIIHQAIASCGCVIPCDLRAFWIADPNSFAVIRHSLIYRAVFYQIFAVPSRAIFPDRDVFCAA